MDVASLALERGLGFTASTAATTRTAGPGLAERLIGTWKLKSCRHLAEDEYCDAWELSKEEAERIYGEEAKELFELRTVEKATSWFTAEEVEVYSLKPDASLCFQCPFFERR
ncbi:MAG: hypothetical protein QW328_07185 [Nitrososphaerota archaeon]